MESAVYVGFKAANRLDELGTSEAILHAAAAYGSAYSAECTANDPPTARGFILWSKTVRGVRDGHADLGWVRNQKDRCYPITIHPDGKWAIAVAGGDEDTGKEDGRPSTRSTKGRSTKEAVHMNQQVFDLGDITRIKKEAGIQTWVLLVHEDKDTDEIRLELSLPVRVNAEGYVDSWSERIILAPLLPGAPGVKAEPNTPGSSPPEVNEEVDIEVRRRAG